jgi:hypothetical protein
VWALGGELTSNLVVNSDGMECLAADRAAVCLFGPFPKTGVVQHVATDLNFGYIFVVDVFWPVFLVWFGECIGIFNGEAFVVVFQQLLFCRV